MFLKNFKFYDPDDAGGQGEEKPKDTQLDAVKAVADGIKAAIEAARATPAPAIAPTKPDPRAALEAEAVKVNEEYNALMADGKYAEAANLRDSYKLKAAQAFQGDPSDSPLVKTAVALGKKAAKAEHGDIMSKWGSEVESIVNSMAVEDRISPDAWEKAVSQVKTNHFDELLEAAAAKKVSEGGFIAPPSVPGSRGRKGSNDPGLDEVELIACEITGVTPEAYAKRKKEADDYDKIPLRQRGAYEGYPVAPATVTPGRF